MELEVRQKCSYRLVPKLMTFISFKDLIRLLAKIHKAELQYCKLITVPVPPPSLISRLWGGRLIIIKVLLVVILQMFTKNYGIGRSPTLPTAGIHNSVLLLLL